MSIQKASKNEVRKEIADLINRIKEQSDRIGMQREIPQSELDLILHRIEELHRKTVVWSYLNELPEEVPGTAVADKEIPVRKTMGFQLPVSRVEEKKEQKKEDIQEEKVAPPVENKITPEVVQEKPAVVPEPVKKDPEPAVVKNEPVVKSEPELVKPEPGPVKSEPVITTVEPQSTTQETVNRKPLKDVKSFIGFNEKLMYIRQVFKGDSAAYEAALAQFNSMNSWDEAQSFLSVLSNEYGWGRHDEPVEIFTQTIKRRFS